MESTQNVQRPFVRRQQCSPFTKLKENQYSWNTESRVGRKKVGLVRIRLQTRGQIVQGPIGCIKDLVFPKSNGKPLK